MLHAYPAAVASTIFTLALAPIRVAPAVVMAFRSSRVRIPPDAFTPIPGPTTPRIRAISCAVAPAVLTSPEARGGDGRYPLHWPIEGTLTSRFGRRGTGRHDGIDIEAPRGALVRAAADGEVLFAAPHGGYGNLVLVRHPTGWVTVYAHHERILVRKVQGVSAGQAIATVGDSGHATGPHLHFEVRRGVQPDNPLHYLPP